MPNSNDDFFGGDKSPIYFVPEGKGHKINPIYSLDDLGTNDPDRFVIVKTTANGKFMIGKMLHYIFNGVDIITESTNAIFVDRPRKTVFVRDYSKALNEVNPVDPEERQYLMILYNPHDDEDIATWVSMVGRTDCYKWIVDNVESFDPATSLVLTDNVALKDALTVSQFVKHLHNADIVDDDFDIEVYEFEES